ncbi:MAG: NADH-quinone oxidoreductase subunit C [Deltaproteobacteria bacterium]|nr:NADH-quinone oxidoreductase subunit C [Deltaproteobacteria bacterium]
MSEKILARLKERFGDAVNETHSYRGDDTALVARERIVEVLQFLRDDPELALNMPVDMTAIDWLARGRVPRFQVVYHLYSVSQRHRVRIKCDVPEEDPRVHSSVSIYPGFCWFEREAWDMYGIKFEGHPDPRRLFMYESFVGHPLRKDYPKEKRQPLVRREGVG